MKRIVLAIGTHPDDIEIGCGGTLLTLRELGYDLIHLIVTSGEEGSLETTKKRTANNRESEANESAKILGASKIIFFREPDGLASFSKELKVRLISLLRELRPETIFTHAESDHFPDHQVVHHLTKSAIQLSAGPWYPEAGLSPHQVKNVYGYEVWNPISKYQFAIDISSKLNRKIEALNQHRSQLRKINYTEAVKGLARYRGVTSMVGDYAEVFEVIKSGGFE